MLRRNERIVVGACILAVAIVSVAGILVAPSSDQADLRLSTYSAGPQGAKGLAQTLRHLGLTVEQRRRPYFDLERDSAPPPPTALLAFLDISPPNPRELAAVRTYVAHGGRILVVGSTGIESCFGYLSRRVRRGADSSAVAAPPGLFLPFAHRALARLPAESLPRARRAPLAGSRDRCQPLAPARVDTVLRTPERRAVALRLGFASGGQALLLADRSFITNRALKETDAGLVVLPWIADGHTRRVTVDEYHQGYGSGGSLLAASAAWLTGHAVGWAILQLVAVTLILLAVRAARFGPARSVIERRRRSPIEHLEALAAGLEGAGGADTAVTLTVQGLRRRLGRAGVLAPEAQRAWVAALELGLPTPAGRNAVRRLEQTIARPGGPERALAAAQAVEDLWEELRPPTTRAGY